MHKNLAKVGRVVPKIWSRTDKHTDRQTRSSRYSASASLSGGGVTRVSPVNGPIIIRLSHIRSVIGMFGGRMAVTLKTATANDESCLLVMSTSSCWLSDSAALWASSDARGRCPNTGYSASARPAGMHDKCPPVICSPPENCRRI